MVWVRFCIAVLGSFDIALVPLSASASVISVYCPQRVVPSLTSPVSAAFPNHVFSSTPMDGLVSWGHFVVHLSFCCLGVLSCFVFSVMRSEGWVPLMRPLSVECFFLVLCLRSLSYPHCIWWVCICYSHFPPFYG